MVLTIKRFKDIYDGTIGEFALVDQYRILMQGNTLEAAGPDTVEPNKDRRIPVGEYNVLWHDSPKFKERLPLLYNELVPKSRAILIHRGNFPRDTEGCILLGNGYDDKGVYNSRDTVAKFMSLVKDKEFKVIIKDAR
nr:MAG TPA: L,D-transpeptidase catalytic domain [Caudoviricetes sp.]